MDDFEEDLFQEIVDLIENDRRIVIAGLEVMGSAGSIILSGIVQSEEARKTAEKIARSVQGVSFVKNNIRVRTGIESRTGETVIGKVKELIRTDSVLSREDVTLTIEEGTLVIEGTVGNIKRKKRFAELIEHVPGISRYSLRIAAVPARSISDEVIGYNVLRDLDRHLNMDINPLDVIVDRGTVTLTGTVHSLTAKNAMYETVLMISGVIQVIDKTDIVP